MFLDVYVLLNKQDSYNVLFFIYFCLFIVFQKNKCIIKLIEIIKSAGTINLSNFRTFLIEKRLPNVAQNKEGNN